MHQAQVVVSAQMSLGVRNESVSSEGTEGILMTTPTPSASVTESTTLVGCKIEMI